jgi:uncharacterized membrane protein (UPF0127 family)
VVLPALLLALALPGCRAGSSGDAGATGGNAAGGAVATVRVPVTITGPGGRHVFRSEVAATPQQQETGLMYRTGLADDFGMLFAPYPADGGPPREASFWMENTPSPLDLIFIRPDRTIARIAENAVPFDRTPIPSGEPVAAVLEVRGGRTAELGIAEGDRVSWPAPPK